MESKMISAHQLAVYDALRQLDGWSTSKEIAAKAGVAWRTARAHCLRLFRLGIFEQAEEVFPARHYRISRSHFTEKQAVYFARLNAAREVLQP